MKTYQSNAQKRGGYEPWIVLAALVVFGAGVAVYVLYDREDEEVAPIAALPGIETNTQTTQEAAGAELVAVMPKPAPGETVKDAQDNVGDVAKALAVEEAPADDAPPAPSFDLLRVESDGSAVVAGRAEPNVIVAIMANTETLGTARAGADGSFVALLDLPKDGAARELELVVDAGAASERRSERRFLVLPIKEEAEAAPAIVAADATGAEIVQPAEPIKVEEEELEATLPSDDVASANAPDRQSDLLAEPEPSVTEPAEPAETSDNVEGVAVEDAIQIDPVATPEPAVALPNPAAASDLTLDTISYAESGDVVLSGRGGEGAVRVYVDNEPVTIGTLVDGRWRLSLPNVDEGIYTVRVDALSEEGEVTARVESPFKRETPDPEALGPEITVQPGLTLWRLAERKYGSGAQYVQIFEANKDLIKDPNLIYPGQIFDLPDE